MGMDEEDPIGQDFLMALTIATCGILLSSLPCVCISQEDSRCKGKTVEEPLDQANPQLFPQSRRCIDL